MIGNTQGRNKGGYVGMPPGRAYDSGGHGEQAEAKVSKADESGGESELSPIDAQGGELVSSMRWLCLLIPPAQSGNPIH